MKVEVGGKYRNVHTWEPCEVLEKRGFIIVYEDDKEEVRSCHIRKFLKEWDIDTVTPPLQ